MNFETLPTDHNALDLGPFHPGLGFLGRLCLEMDGETVVSARVDAGFAHKGLEKVMEAHSWLTLLPYADRLDPENSVLGELAVCMGVEQICKLEVPPRAQAIRLMVTELSRISSHFAFLARFSRVVGAETCSHYILREREKLLDLFELLAGARFNLNFLRFGGLGFDVSEGFLERVAELSELILIRMREYREILSDNYGFNRRTDGVGRIETSLASELGLTGPNARASGLSFDTRKAAPYCGSDTYFQNIQNMAAPHREGDARSRFEERMREVIESIQVVKQVAEALPAGPYLGKSVSEDYRIPSGEAYIRVESPRGMLACHLVSDGGSHPCRVQFRTPSIQAISVLERILVGAQLSDLPVIVASMDVSISEVDR